MSFFDAGITLPPMVIDDTKLPSFVQDFNGYAIEGDMPYANTGDVVLCITGDGKIIKTTLCSQFLKLSIPVCRTNLSAANCTWQPKVRVQNSATLQSLLLPTQMM